MTTINTIHDLHRILVEHPEWRSELRNVLLTEELLALPQQFAEQSETMDNKLDTLTDLTNLNTRHIGEVKGLFMERAAREDAAVITGDMGLEWRKTLERNEVGSIATMAERAGLTAGISRDTMRTFHRADLIIEALDDRGESCYVAVEISYTADDRDTERAIRHAELLTRFTGVPAYSAIASVHIDNRIRNILTEDPPQPHSAPQEVKVFWSRLPELEPAN